MRFVKKIKTQQKDQFIVRILCQSGVPLHTKDKEGRTALHLAAKRNQSKLIPILIEYHAELDICDSQGNSALMMAAAEGIVVSTIYYRT